MGAGLPGSPGIDQRLAVVRKAEALVIDIDGVLYEGNRALPGAAELISEINEHGTPHIFLSNNSTFPYQYHVEMLSRLGAQVGRDSILTAALVTARVLALESEPGTCCYVIGEQGLIEALQQAGFRVTQTDYINARYVVIGMDRQLTYEKLKGAALAIRNGSQFICSNPDPNYPDGENLLPASGALQAALEASTGVRARVTGKPALPGFEMALEKLGSLPQQTAMLGDQPEIDMIGAAQAGMLRFLVLSSLTEEHSANQEQTRSDAVFRSTAEFVDIWRRRY